MRWTVVKRCFSSRFHLFWKTRKSQIWNVKSSWTLTSWKLSDTKQYNEIKKLNSETAETHTTVWLFDFSKPEIPPMKPPHSTSPTEIKCFFKLIGKDLKQYLQRTRTNFLGKVFTVRSGGSVETNISQKAFTCTRLKQQNTTLQINIQSAEVVGLKLYTTKFNGA